MRERRSITSCRTGAASRLVGLWSRRRLPYRIVPYLAVRPGRERGREFQNRCCAVEGVLGKTGCGNLEL